jgi:hypothetical protein
MMIVNDDPWFVNKLEASLTDHTTLVIYDHSMFIVQATERVAPGKRRSKTMLII